MNINWYLEAMRFRDAVLLLRRKRRCDSFNEWLCSGPEGGFEPPRAAFRVGSGRFLSLKFQDILRTSATLPLDTLSL